MLFGILIYQVETIEDTVPELYAVIRTEEKKKTKETISTALKKTKQVVDITSAVKVNIANHFR